MCMEECGMSIDLSELVAPVPLLVTRVLLTRHSPPF